jgi:hypothetical protein
MGSVAEEGCVILVRDVCEMLAIRITTGGMSFARIWPHMAVVWSMTRQTRWSLV